MIVPKLLRKYLIGITAALLVILIVCLFSWEERWARFLCSVSVFIAVLLVRTLIPSRRERRKKGLWEEDESGLFFRLYKTLSYKTREGADLSALNEYEKVFLTMAELEVQRGWFPAFFTDLHGAYNDLLVPSAEAVGALEIAEICKDVLALYAGYTGPEDGLEDLFQECIDGFADSEEDLVELCAKYAREHKESFREY